MSSSWPFFTTIWKGNVWYVSVDVWHVSIHLYKIAWYNWPTTQSISIACGYHIYIYFSATTINHTLAVRVIWLLVVLFKRFFVRNDTIFHLIAFRYGMYSYIFCMSHRFVNMYWAKSTGFLYYIHPFVKLILMWNADYWNWNCVPLPTWFSQIWSIVGQSHLKCGLNDGEFWN